ncbi:hypothetical protein AQPW35_19450 [Rubrivivax pictus]|uniref:Uncharacterized protein n=2 Tax=Pseudaquabacterium pictum TaxID=2315236 RepID=A0A480AMQ2_9BURK|nr:hypothetical protein AQPW35_19450 [Rubrivivax pictus]
MVAGAPARLATSLQLHVDGAHDKGLLCPFGLPVMGTLTAAAQLQTEEDSVGRACLLQSLRQLSQLDCLRSRNGGRSVRLVDPGAEMLDHLMAEGLEIKVRPEQTAKSDTSDWTATARFPSGPIRRLAAPEPFKLVPLFILREEFEGMCRNIGERPLGEFQDSLAQGLKSSDKTLRHALVDATKTTADQRAKARSFEATVGRDTDRGRFSREKRDALIQTYALSLVSAARDLSQTRYALHAEGPLAALADAAVWDGEDARDAWVSGELCYQALKRWSGAQPVVHSSPP